MNKAYLLLGTNIGDRKKNISVAEDHIEKEIGMIRTHSSIYETAAWGKKEQASFLNKVVIIETEKKARQILELVLAIEKKMGRVRNEKWEERIIDIDILFFNDEIILTEDLKVPHPFIQERRFTLEPLNEIEGSFVHPVFGTTIKELLSICNDTLRVQKIE